MRGGGDRAGDDGRADGAAPARRRPRGDGAQPHAVARGAARGRRRRTRGATPAEAAAAAEAVLTCVSDTPDLEHVLLGPGRRRRGTRAPEGSSWTARRCRRRRLPRLPRSCASAASAWSTRPCRAAPRAPSAARSRSSAAAPTPTSPAPGALLEAFGSRITHLGPSGAGQVAKAVNQVMIAGTYASVGEGIALAEAAGLDLPAARRGAVGRRGRVVGAHRTAPANMIADTYPLGFKVALHRKDLGIALDEAGRAGLPLAVSARRRAGGRAHGRGPRRRGRERPRPPAQAR